MIQRQYLMIFLALGSMLAVGITATTLESSLETAPHEAIDVDYAHLPFGQEHVVEAQRESARNGHSGSAETEPQSAEAADAEGISDSSIRSLIAFLLVLAGLALAYRYRERLLAGLSAVLLAGRGWFEERATPMRAGAGTWPTRQPSNEVQAAWLTMVRRTDIERPWARTPSECAQAAVAAGMDPEAVATLTALFEEDTYGDAPMTPQRRRRAREWLRRLDERGGQYHERGGQSQ